jgi:hypothetical protein
MRQEQYNVVPPVMLQPDTVTMSDSQVFGINLRNTINGLLQTAGTVGNIQLQQAEKNKTILEATGKLMVADNEVRKRYNIAQVQAEERDVNDATRLAMAKIDQSERDHRELKQQNDIGIAAYINSKPTEDVARLIDRGNGIILSPDSMNKAEELFGSRLAQEDLNTVLQNINEQMLKDPSVRFDTIVEQVAGQRSFSSPFVQATYLNELRSNANRYYGAKQLELQEQNIKEGFATLGLSAITSITFDAKENKTTPESLSTALGNYVQGYKQLKPAASDLELVAGLSDVLDKAFTGDTVAFNVPQLEQAYMAVQPLAESQPGVFGNVLVSLGERLTKERTKTMSANYDAFDARLSAAGDSASVNATLAAIDAVAQQPGGLSADKFLKLTTKATEKLESVRLRTEVDQVRSGERNDVAINSIHDKDLDASIAEDAAKKGWIFDRKAREYGRAGHVSSSFVDNLRSLGNTKVDPANPQTAIQVTNAVAGIEAIRQENPRLAREITDGDKAGRRLSVLADGYHYLGILPASMAQELSEATDLDFIEADNILDGTVTTDTAKKASNFNQIVDDVYNGWYFTKNVNRPIKDADSAYKAAFRYAYAAMNKIGTDPDKVVRSAQKEATRLLEQNFSRVRILNDVHVVSNKKFPHAPKSEMRSIFVEVLQEEVTSRKGVLWKANRDSMDYDDIGLDFDNSVMKDGQYFVPFVNKKTGIAIRDTQGQATGVSAPYYHNELKAAYKVIADREATKYVAERQLPFGVGRK